MRVSLAKIRLYLKTSKKLADGSHPIMLMCSFNGRKEVSTSCSCIPKYWDKKGECVKKGYPNWLVINSMIKKMKDDAIAIRDEYERLGEVYKPSMILSPKKVLCAVRSDLKTLISEYIDEKGVDVSTAQKWWVVYRSVVKFNGGREVIVNEVDESFCRRYGRYLKDDCGLAVGTVRSYLTKLSAIFHYCVMKGILSISPIKDWKYYQDYRDSKNELYIHSRSMEFLMDMLVSEIIIKGDGGRWSYRDDVDRLLDVNSKVYALYLYCIGYYLKGISPIDISLLKKSDIRHLSVKGQGVYAIDGYRSKSGMPYKIRLLENSFLSNVLVRTMLMFNEGDYFLPTLNGFKGKDVKKRINNVYTSHKEDLLDWFRLCNQKIVEHNMTNGDNVQLIDLNCRYYSYRHSYLMSEIQKPNVNLLKIATECGKSVRTLHQYITLLNDEDLI